MKKLIIRVLLVVAVFFAAYRGALWWQSERIGTQIVNVIALPQQNARAIALATARSSLKAISEPNVYGYVTQADIQSSVNAALKTRQEAPADQVMLGAVTVLARPEDLGITVPFDATSHGVVQLAGKVEINAALSANGSYLDLHPLAAQIRLDRLRLSRWTFDGSEAVARGAASVLNTVLTFVTRRVAGLSVPLTLGASRTLDVTTLAPGLSIEGGRALNVRVGAEHLAVLPTDGGVHVLGRLVAISDGDFSSTLAALKAIRDKAREAGPLSEQCPTCDLSEVGIGGYFSCARTRAVCEARRTLRTPPGADRRLTPPQALVLSELKHSPDQQLQELYEFYEPMLVPFGNIEEQPAAEMSDLRYSAAVREVLQELLARRAEVDAVSVLEGQASHFAVQKRFIAQSVASILQPLRTLAVIAAIPGTTQESIAQDLISDPAPNLNCERNSRPCESVFEFRTEPDRPCKSNCATNDMKCLFGICTNVPGIDLNCQGEKTNCEAIKAREKLEWAAERAARQVAWSAKKAACETAKGLERAGCELNQGWLNDWGSKRLGHLDGVAKISGARGEYRLSQTTLADDLSSATIGGAINGGMHVTATFVYTPDNSLQGRLVCAAQWGGDVHADVGFNPQPLSLRVTLDEPASQAGGLVVFRTEPQELVVTMVPPPGIALLKDTPQMAVACPFVGAALATPGVNILVTVKLATTDSFKVPVKGQEFRFGEVALPGLERKLRLKLGPRTIVGTLG